jgi:hypothetical protein
MEVSQSTVKLCSPRLQKRADTRKQLGEFSSCLDPATNKLLGAYFWLSSKIFVGVLENKLGQRMYDVSANNSLTTRKTTRLT